MIRDKINYNLYHILWKQTKLPLHIFISGKKQHGKDTFGNQLRTQLTSLSNGRFSLDQKKYYRIANMTIHKVSFASPIKIFTKSIFGLDDRQLNGDQKEDKLSFWNNLTPREIMQQVGSKLRDINIDVFPKSLVMRVKRKEETTVKYYRGKQAPHVFINADCRYPNEISITKKELSRVIYIRIVRPDIMTTKYDNHISEIALDNYQDWDHIIMNNGTIDDLRMKAKKLLASWIYINENNYTGTIL